MGVEDVKFDTRLLHTGVEIDPATGAVTVPVYQVSTFHQESPDKPGRYDYARSGNPTRAALEEAMAALEGGAMGLAFSSGMGAISSVLCLFSQGDHLVVGEDVYGGTYRALTRIFSRFGIEATFVDTTDLERVRKAIRPRTRALLLESPSNPLLRITDLAGAASLARERGLLTIVDNTFMTPYFQRPLELGADIVAHSATKYLGGHSDLIAGVVVTRTEELGKELAFIQNAIGAVPGPWDCWLVLRGIKTLQVRLEKQQRSAMEVALWLRRHPRVTAVYYPGLPEHPGHELHRSQASGFGAVVSFALESPELAWQVLRRVKLPVRGPSLGSVESILSFPAAMSHAALPPELRKRLGIGDNLLRLSVGLEDPQDLIADLDQALAGSRPGLA